MKILVISNHRKVLSLIFSLMEGSLRAEVITSEKAKDAVNLIETIRGIDCIICDADLPNNGLEDVIQKLSEQQLFIPLILCADHHPSHYPTLESVPYLSYILKPDIGKKLIEIVSNQFQTQTSRIILDSQQYCRIKIDTLLQAGISKFDIYIRLADQKFVRIYKKGDPENLLDLDRYKDKNVDTLFVKRDKLDDLVEELSQKLSLELDRSATTLTRTYEISTSALETIHQFSHSFGFSQELKAMTDLCVSNIIRSIQNSEKLAESLKTLQVSGDNYIYTHSVILSHVSCALASLQDWCTEDCFQKLATAALLHDISLNNEDLAKFQDLADFALATDRFSKTDQEAFKKHPYESVKALKILDSFEEDTIRIILQHHERPDGSGFPKQLRGDQIDKLSALFIVAHDIVTHALLQNQGSIDLSKYLKEKKSLFSKGFFNKLIHQVMEKAKVPENH